MTGCQPCATSNFVNDCQGCTLNGCLVSCESCLATNTPNNRTGGPPVSVTIPDGGCEVFNYHSQLICIPGSEGSCPLGEQSVTQHAGMPTCCIAISTHHTGISLVACDCCQAVCWAALEPTTCMWPHCPLHAALLSPPAPPAGIVLICTMQADSLCAQRPLYSACLLSSSCATHQESICHAQHAQLQVCTIIVCAIVAHPSTWC